jgi:hypothetical protein
VVVAARAGSSRSFDASRNDQREIGFVSLAPTNKACRIIDGQTIHKFCCTYSKKIIKSLDAQYIFIDEVSMVAEKFYKFVNTVKSLHPDIKFIIAGDYGQLHPVGDRIENCHYEYSAVRRELVDGRRLHLTKCRRSDTEVHDMCLPDRLPHLSKEDFGQGDDHQHLLHQRQ